MGIFSRMFENIADTATSTSRERGLPVAQSTPLVSNALEVRDDSAKPKPATGPRPPMVFINGISHKMTIGLGVNNM